MSAPVDVLAYGVAEREGGSLIALKFTREDAADYVAKASSEYRNQSLPAPGYRTIGLVNADAVAELIEAAEETIATQANADCSRLVEAVARARGAK